MAMTEEDFIRDFCGGMTGLPGKIYLNSCYPAATSKTFVPCPNNIVLTDKPNNIEVAEKVAREGRVYIAAIRSFMAAMGIRDYNVE